MEMLDDFMPGEVGLIFVFFFRLSFFSSFFFFKVKLGFVLSGNLKEGIIRLIRVTTTRNIFKFEKLIIYIACRILLDLQFENNRTIAYNNNIT